MPGISTQIKARKERRKMVRRKRKRHEKSIDLQEENPREIRDSANASFKKQRSGSTDDKASKKIMKNKKSKKHADPYHHLSPGMAAAMRRDDDEIAELEQKLGIGKKKGGDKKSKDKLNKEYAKLEGYGDGFGDFLDDLDDMVKRVTGAAADETDDLNDGDHATEADGHETEYAYDSDHALDDDEGEELIPMKGPSEHLDEDDSVLEELEMMEKEELASREQQNDSEGDEDTSDRDDDESNSANSSEDSSSDNDEEAQADHDIADTYRPSKGQDIYGNMVDTDAGDAEKPSKYVPPHLRKKQQAEENEDDQEKQRLIRRALNNALNRLSEDTMISVAQQVAGLYASNPSQLVHELIWENAKGACVELPMLMTGLIPVYMACITGVHLQTGDTVQVGEVILEKVVVDLWKRLEAWRNYDASEESSAGHEKEIKGKHICNLMLVLSYLYNYNIIHCSFMYDVIRHLIESFSEVDIECLLVLLSHCGRSLRSDDPLALKEIVLLVQKKKAQGRKLASSSRSEYMISAIMDLKNNRRKKQDSLFSEKAAKLRKLLGQIKSSAARSGASKAVSEASLRISLEDVLKAETNGRWWKVGASWVGNQYRFSEESSHQDENNKPSAPESLAESKEDEHLLKLANKLRMNTDRKRSIFCIIMGGSDCEDTFEKLCRLSMLQNRSERDAVRVLLECCGQEKSYNKFYGHLAARICEYQPQSRFSLQLAYWDAFKQFNVMGVRKAANLAKLLFHLVVTHQILKLFPVIKAIDISDEDMDQTALLFLTLLFSSILEHFEDPMEAKALFSLNQEHAHDEFDSEEDENKKHRDHEDGVRAGLLVFFMKTLKSSPKNTKGSRFHKNFKAVVKALDADGFENIL